MVGPPSAKVTLKFCAVTLAVEAARIPSPPWRKTDHPAVPVTDLLGPAPVVGINPTP